MKKLLLLLTIGIIISSLFVGMLIKNTKTDKENFKHKQYIPWHIENANLQDVWIDFTGNNVKVAILDTGIDIKHPDLSNNVKGTYNAIENNDIVDDESGHGTLIAGIIAAENNKFGIVGIAPEADLYIVKVLDENAEGTVEDFVKGIEWCVQNNIQIINLSFGISKDIPQLKHAIENALNAGIIIVASSGNTAGGDAEYPAAYEGVISVAALDKANERAEFTAKGKIDFCSTGIDILSTSLDSKYESCNGSSFATACVTGLITLKIQQVNDELNQEKMDSENVLEVLKECTIDLGIEGKDTSFGYGKLSINN